MTAKYSKAESYLIKKDSLLGALIERNGPLAPRIREGYFDSLVRAIIGQQISVASATAIYKRFIEKTELQPIKALELDQRAIKYIGLSERKALYLRDLAEHFASDPDVFNHLDRLNDEDVIKELVQIKGIGVWTAQMFLMFTLGRPDIFAPADRGLQIAIERLYGYSKTPSLQELETIAENWAPYRTTASMHLWQSLKNQPV